MNSPRAQQSSGRQKGVEWLTCALGPCLSLLLVVGGFFAGVNEWHGMISGILCKQQRPGRANWRLATVSTALSGSAWTRRRVAEWSPIRIPSIALTRLTTRPRKFDGNGPIAPGSRPRSLVAVGHDALEYSLSMAARSLRLEPLPDL
jgi:hypothetical protein